MKIKFYEFFIVRQWIACLVLVIFTVEISLPVQAQSLMKLLAPGVRVHLSPPFTPPVLKGLKVYPENPFQFDFIVDAGDAKGIGGRGSGIGPDDPQIKAESTKLIKYFLTALTIPENDLWVNLSPYEKDRIITDSFGSTEMGRDLLAQDYLLKQITATLMYPEEEWGKKFWDRVRQQAQEKFGSTEIPINTFNKVWIVPQKAVVFEKDNTVFVEESWLKVMLEEDYVAMQHNLGSGIGDQGSKHDGPPTPDPPKSIR